MCCDDPRNQLDLPLQLADNIDDGGWDDGCVEIHLMTLRLMILRVRWLLLQAQAITVSNWYNALEWFQDITSDDINLMILKVGGDHCFKPNKDICERWYAWVQCKSIWWLQAWWISRWEIHLTLNPIFKCLVLQDDFRTWLNICWWGWWGIATVHNYCLNILETWLIRMRTKF